MASPFWVEPRQILSLSLLAQLKGQDHEALGVETQGLFLSSGGVTESVVFGTTNREQTGRLPTELDLKTGAWLQTEHRGVCLTHHEVPVELDFGCVGELAASFTYTYATSSEFAPLGIEQSLLEGCEAHTV